MAARLLLPRASFLPLCTGVGLASAMAYAQSRPVAQVLRCDAPPTWTSQSRSPLAGRHARVDAKLLRQVTTGSIAGLLGGLVVSTLSKPLTLLIGLLFAGVQALNHFGLNVIPYNLLKRRIQNTNVKSLLFDNPAFKYSLGITFALAAFAEF